jgi:sugar lactone lactonase YvrE
MKTKRITRTYKAISKELVMTKKRNWLGMVVLLAVVAVVAVGCEQIIGLLGFGDEEEPIVPALANGDPIVEVSTFAGTGEKAEFNDPYGVAVDRDGNVYVADTYNLRIRMITPQGVVSTIASEFNNPMDVAVDSKCNVYVADSYNNRICMLSPNEDGTFEVSTIVKNNGEFSRPSGVAVDSKYNVYVADFFNNRICKIDNEGDFSILASGPDVVGFPMDVAVDSKYNVYVADSYNNRILKITPQSDGTFEVSTLAGKKGEAGHVDGRGTEARFNVPTGVAVDSKYNVYVADSGSHRICKITPDGNVITLAGGSDMGGYVDDVPGSEARFYTPTGVAVDGAGNVYVADHRNRRIRKLTITTP